MQHQKAILVDPVTGVSTIEFAFPEGEPQKAIERAVSPAGPRPGYELRTRWESKPDGQRVLRIGEVLCSDSPPAIDDLDSKNIGQLVTLGVLEGLNGKNGKTALNTQMHLHDVKNLIRENRKEKAKATKEKA